MPTPSNEVLRARRAIDIAAPATGNAVGSPGSTTPVQNLQPPPIRSFFTPQGATGQSVPGISWDWLKWLQQLFSTIKGQTTSFEDTRANRVANYPAGNYQAGSTFFETDTGLTYIDNGTNWVYTAGIEQVTQATLPTGLGVSDTGLLVNVTDFRHTLQWSGSAWEWGPGDMGSGQVASFLSNPGAGWNLCDGSSVNYLNSDGTVSAITLPNYTTPAYLKLGTTANAGPNAPSGTTSSVSAGTPAGTVSAPSFTGTPVTPTFTGSAGTTGVESADTTVQSGTGASVASASHTHGFTPAGTISTVTPAGAVSAPTFTGSALPTHSHAPGTIDLTNTVLLAYFRQ